MSLLDCRDKVRDEINNSLALGAESVLVPVTTFQGVKLLKVFVVGLTTITNLINRIKSRKIYTVQIGIIQKVESNNVDPETVLKDITDSVENLFNNKNLPVASQFPTYYASGVSTPEYYSYPKLDIDNIIQSVLEVTYKEFVT